MILSLKKFTMEQNRRGSKLSQIYKYRHLFLMLLPAFIFTFIFAYTPLFGWIIAFKNYSVGMNIFEAPWVGLKQFKTFFLESSDFIYVFKNTLGMNILSLFFSVGLAFVLAILLKEFKFAVFRRTVQSITFIPYFISWVTVYSITHAMFAAQSGVINMFLIKLGILNEGINLLGSSSYSWLMIICLNVWKNIGYNSVIFLSALSGISQEQYESADMDGANRFKKILHITIPNLIPTLIVLLVLNSGWLLNSNFEQFYMFTNSANWDTMEVFDMYMYKFGIQLMNYSYATAVGIIRTAASVILLLLVNGFSKKVTEKSVF